MSRSSERLTHNRRTRRRRASTTRATPLVSAATPLEYALVMFADLRGFTPWSAAAAVGPHLQGFMSDFYDLFRTAPGMQADTFVKPNGDGVLVVRSTGQTNDLLDAVLDQVLNDTLVFVGRAFSNLVQRYQRIMRCAIPLRLGFGINAGLVHRLQFRLGDGAVLTDFASGTINTAARLCDFARPEGVVIASEAFPDWTPPRGSGFQLVQADVRSVGRDYPVWVSRSLLGPSAPREMRSVALEFHVGTVCYDPAAEVVLLARRNTDRELYPGLWETGGGQLYREEGLEDAAVRIARTEFGIGVIIAWNASVTPFKITTERRSIPGIKVLCLFTLASYANFADARQHTETRAVSLKDLAAAEHWPDAVLIPGAKDVVRELVARYASTRHDTAT